MEMGYTAFIVLKKIHAVVKSSSSGKFFLIVSEHELKANEKLQLVMEKKVEESNTFSGEKKELIKKVLAEEYHENTEALIIQLTHTLIN